MVTAGGGNDTQAPIQDPPAGEPAAGPARAPRSGTALRRTAIWALVVIVVMLGSLAIVVNAVMGGLASLNPFRDLQEHTTDRSGPAVVKAISDLGEFHAASGYYELVIDVEKEIKPLPSFLVGERVLFIAAGNVDASVDLTALDEDAITINGDRTTATITLPAPALSKPNLDTERSHVFSRDRGLITRLGDAVQDDPDDQRDMYLRAEGRLSEAAAGTDELTDRAETNTRAMLEGLLHSLGFTDVTVDFEPAPDPSSSR